MLVAVQMSVAGLYLAPVLKLPKSKLNPPQTIISLPVHTAAVIKRGFRRIHNTSSSPGIIGAVQRNGDFRGISHPPETGDARAKKTSNQGAPIERPEVETCLDTPFNTFTGKRLLLLRIAIVERENKIDVIRIVSDRRGIGTIRLGDAQN